MQTPVTGSFEGQSEKPATYSLCSSCSIPRWFQTASQNMGKDELWVLKQQVPASPE